jgi:SAM-dependent methyltransferase
MKPRKRPSLPPVPAFPGFQGVSKLRPRQFEALAGSLAQGGRFLEVGTLHGVTAARLAKACPEAWVVSVDVFRELNPNAWLANRQPNQSLFVGTLQEFALYARPGQFDVVWIDADHRFEPCLADLRTAGGLLKPGGRLFAHDYADPDRLGVTMAIDRFCIDAGKVVSVLAGSLVEIRRP